MAGRGDAGGICGLLDLIEEHRAALRYDWRSRFHLSLDSVPDSVGWDEALDLVRIIRADPSSQLAAAIEGWDHPLERLGWMLADLIDVQGYAKHKKWKPYPRPVKPKDSIEHISGDAAGMTRAESVERLRALGHKLPV